MLRLIIQTKRKYKKIEKQVIEHKVQEGIADKTENCSTDDESGDGQSTKSEDDVDSGVTFDFGSSLLIVSIPFPSRVSFARNVVANGRKTAANRVVC